MFCIYDCIYAYNIKLIAYCLMPGSSTEIEDLFIHWSYACSNIIYTQFHKFIKKRSCKQPLKVLFIHEIFKIFIHLLYQIDKQIYFITRDAFYYTIMNNCKMSSHGLYLLSTFICNEYQKSSSVFFSCTSYNISSAFKYIEYPCKCGLVLIYFV